MTKLLTLSMRLNLDAQQRQCFVMDHIRRTLEKKRCISRNDTPAGDNYLQKGVPRPSPPVAVVSNPGFASQFPRRALDIRSR